MCEEDVDKKDVEDDVEDIDPSEVVDEIDWDEVDVEDMIEFLNALDDEILDEYNLKKGNISDDVICDYLSRLPSHYPPWRKGDRTAFEAEVVRHILNELEDAEKPTFSREDVSAENMDAWYGIKKKIEGEILYDTISRDGTGIRFVDDGEYIWWLQSNNYPGADPTDANVTMDDIGRFGAVGKRVEKNEDLVKLVSILAESERERLMKTPICPLCRSKLEYIRKRSLVDGVGGYYRCTDCEKDVRVKSKEDVFGQYSML